MVNIKTEICHNIFRSASSLMAFENFLRNVPQQTTHQATSAFGGTSYRHRPDRRPGAARPQGQRHRQRSRRRRGKGQARPRRPEGRPQRPLPLRQRQEIQALLREVTAIGEPTRLPWG